MLSSVCAPLTLRIHVKKLSALVHVVILALRRWGSLANYTSPADEPQIPGRDPVWKNKVDNSYGMAYKVDLRPGHPSPHPPQR